MLDFIRKIFGLSSRPNVHPLDGATRQAQEAPYKLEPAPVYRDSIPDEVAKPKLEVVNTTKEKKPKQEKTATKPKKETKPKVDSSKEKPKKPKAKKSA